MVSPLYGKKERELRAQRTFIFIYQSKQMVMYSISVSFIFRFLPIIISCFLFFSLFFIIWFWWLFYYFLRFSTLMMWFYCFDLSIIICFFLPSPSIELIEWFWCAFIFCQFIFLCDIVSVNGDYNTVTVVVMDESHTQ